jgi:uncharacterized membrane protein YfcA
MEEFLIFVLIGFIAQVIDGALGMAYGITTTTFLLNLGLPPVNASAVTHASETITTFFSALSHHRLGNVDPKFFFGLLLPGILGALVGVFVLTHVDGNLLRPYIAVYLLVMGFVVFCKAFTAFPPPSVVRHLTPLGFFGALLDAIGGGGWGAIVTSTLLARGHDARTTIGSVNATEAFITMTIFIGFFLSNVIIGWQIVLALALGGLVAAPLGAWLCKHIPARVLLFLVGLLIIALSSRTLWTSVFQPR